MRCPPLPPIASRGGVFTSLMEAMEGVEGESISDGVLKRLLKCRCTSTAVEGPKRATLLVGAVELRDEDAPMGAPGCERRRGEAKSSNQLVARPKR